MKVLAFDGTTEDWHESIKSIAELADKIEKALKQIDDIHRWMGSSVGTHYLPGGSINEKPKG